MGGNIVLHGHGLRDRQLRGPGAPDEPPMLLGIRVRRYRCTACRATCTVVPAETLTKRLYLASAIVWALALFGLLKRSPDEVRRRVSPLRIWGASAPRRWRTLRDWTVAAGERRLLHCVRATPPSWPLRRVAARAAATVAAYALPVPEPPPLDVLAFLGAARAR